MTLDMVLLVVDHRRDHIWDMEEDPHLGHWELIVEHRLLRRRLLVVRHLDPVLLMVDEDLLHHKWRMIMQEELGNVER